MHNINNIKRLIFDLDNTLIPWNNDYLEAVKKAVLEYKLPCTYEEMDGTYSTFENYYNNYSIANFKEHIKKELGLEVSNEFIEAWLNYLGDMAYIEDGLIDTLTYLKKKYDLVVLTNGFKDSQEKRLKTANIREFFTEVYAGEEYIKPDPRSFLDACGPYLPEECLMIGDIYDIDVVGAMNAGLKAIHFNKKEAIEGITRIRSLNELKNIL